MPTSSKKNYQEILLISTILFLSCASFIRVWSIHGTMWDDNAWLMSIYSSHDLHGFLSTSFTEMRRVPLGIFLYPLFWLHKHTELYFVVWHSLNTVTQIGAPLLLYATCSRLFGDKLLAFFIACSLAVLYLDQTLPYASAINYRIGLLFGILSFYFTVRAMEDSRPLISWIISIFFAVVGYGVFMEAVIALEPGRLAVIFYMQNEKTGKEWRERFKNALLKWWPFLVVSIPFAIYKLAYRSYGLYSGIYEPDFLFLFDIGRILDLLAVIFLFQWVIFADHMSNVSPWSIILGASTFIVLILLLVPREKSKNQISLFFKSKSNKVSEKSKHELAKYALLIGLLLLIFPLAFFQFFRRPITWGIFSSHSAIAQFGYAVIVGTILFLLFNRAAKKSVTRARVFNSGVALFFSLAVFFNNLNYDLYQQALHLQTKFWKSFVTRLPSLPVNATFLVDVRDRTLYNPMYYYYYEFMVNLLYAENSDPDEFRRYRVTTFHELYWQNKIKQGEQLVGLSFTRKSLWGEDQIAADSFIWVYYDTGQLLINNEILKAFPESPYRLILNKPAPKDERIKTYPYRYKVFGLPG